MLSGSPLVDLTRQTILDFCCEFLSRPYLCYTEHGLHALFFSRLFDALPAESRYVSCEGHELCALQKEYPTAGNLGKSRRQHWDISLIKTPIIVPFRLPVFDYLPLAAVVEFGLNCTRDHLEDDISRLCHSEANVENRFIVHLYRLSHGTNKISGRDLAPESKSLISKESIQVMLRNRPVEVFYGIIDATNRYQSGLWLITGTDISGGTCQATL